MFLTQKNAIRGLNVREFSTPCVLCWLSKSMFDVGVVVVHRYYFAEYPHLAYESVYHQAKSNERYELLSNNIAQQTLQVISRTFKSFVKFKDKQRYQHLTERQSRLDRKQNHRVRDYLNQTVSYLINSCLICQIGKLIISCKPDWTQDINLSKPNNQTSVQMPHYVLFMQIAMVRQLYSKKVTTIWISKEWLGGF